VTRLAAQSLKWRLFAIFALVLAGPILLSGPWTAYFALSSTFGLTALAGLTGYAFGFRIGPRQFWGAFSVLFSLGAMFSVGRVIGQGQQPLSGKALFLFMVLLVCLALYRHAEMFGAKDSAQDYRDIFA
jgi:hypothetical protein